MNAATTRGGHIPVALPRSVAQCSKRTARGEKSEEGAHGAVECSSFSLKMMQSPASQATVVTPGMPEYGGSRQFSFCHSLEKPSSPLRAPLGSRNPAK